MKYDVIIKRMDESTDRYTVEARNSKHAHEVARSLYEIEDGDAVRVYPSTVNADGAIIPYNVMRGAVAVAKRSAEKTVSRSGGTETQKRIEAELKAVNAKLGVNGAEQYGCEYILTLLADLSHDSNDFVSCAYNGIISAIRDGEDITEQYHHAYLAINDMVMKQRSATAFECSTEFIEADGGQLVAIGTYIGKIVKNGERYTPSENNSDMDADTAEWLGEVLAGASVSLTPRQKQIVRLVGMGYSQRQIASKLNMKNEATVKDHIALIRKKYADYIAENAPYFMQFVKDAEVKAARPSRQKDRHADTEKRQKDRHASKEQRAEYMRAYRAKKAKSE